MCIYVRIRQMCLHQVGDEKSHQPNVFWFFLWCRTSTVFAKHGNSNWKQWFFVYSSYSNGLVLEARLNQVGMLMAVLIKSRTAEHEWFLHILALRALFQSFKLEMGGRYLCGPFCSVWFRLIPFDILQVQVSNAASMANDVLPTIKPAEWCATQLYVLQICCVADLAASAIQVCRNSFSRSKGGEQEKCRCQHECFSYALFLSCSCPKKIY